ncbi:hypothetical protein PSTG_04682 [Puccinia striiformis f. sp. tritici PST-78]|uniref:Uncharacterized protein n=1 Tax=Puccinia striiformis f. sp. tritici PST-78 TaxID=1165861 RepID=A0A0L0VT50_9BASI|nr:hypothetical protein PSTG_04682 [Puccinia striiformis f. sp. tritici PST-78]
MTSPVNEPSTSENSTPISSSFKTPTLNSPSSTDAESQNVTGNLYLLVFWEEQVLLIAWRWPERLGWWDKGQKMPPWQSARSRVIPVEGNMANVATNAELYAEPAAERTAQYCTNKNKNAPEEWCIHAKRVKC